MSSPLILTKALLEEDLHLYQLVSPLAIGATLIREDFEGQKPVYYASHSLCDAETRYPNLEKLAYTLVIARIKIRQYLQGRIIVILTDQPLRRVLYLLDLF